MLRFLSPEWIAALDAAAREIDATTDTPFVIEQIVQRGDDTVRWQLDFGPNGVRFIANPIAAADLTLTSDAMTAAAVSQGEQSAQAAFMAGRLHLRGDTAALIRNATAFARVTDAFAAVRALTDYTS
jgi:predicted lipid carrier protein YhbT